MLPPRLDVDPMITEPDDLDRVVASRANHSLMMAAPFLGLLLGQRASYFSRGNGQSRNSGGLQVYNVCNHVFIFTGHKGNLHVILTYYGRIPPLKQTSEIRFTRKDHKP